MHKSNKSTLIKLFGALVLAVASLAIVAPALNVSAERKPSQQQPTQDQGSINAPVEKIRPSSVVVVNLKKMAAAQKRAAEKGVPSSPETQTPAEVDIHAPLTIKETNEQAPQAPPSASSSSDTGGPLIPSPGPALSFVAQPDEFRVGTTSRFIPPDTTGAVSTTRLFSNLNSNYRVQDKTTGAELSTVGMSTFWAPLNSATPSPSPSPVAGVFDPRVQYDPYNGRWIMAAASNGQSSSASILVGISNTSDPQGAFTLYRFVVGCAGGDAGCDSGGEWADFPMLGFNKNWVVVA